MKIGIDISAFGERSTGTSRYINCLLTQLKTTGHEIKVFPSEPIIQTTKEHKTGILPILKRGGLRRHWYRNIRLAGEMETAGVDMGIFPNYLKPLNFHKPSLIVIHDLSFYSHPQFYSRAFVLYYKDQLARILKSSPIIATVSNCSRESIMKYLGISEDKIFLLQPYVDSNSFKIIKDPFPGEMETPYFLYVGHIEPRKNLSFLIRNFIKWKSSCGIKIRLKIAGEIWMNSADVKEIIHKYNNHPDIEFTGYVEENELHRLYSNASGFVHASIVEGFGFPVLEAMHYGLPVLCSSGTSTEEITSPCSITINPHSDKELQSGLDRLLAKSFNRVSYPEFSYSPEVMRKQLDRILESAIGKKTSILCNVSLNEVETVVQKTLLYYKLFDSGLNVDMLSKFLLDLKVTRCQLDEAVASLIKRNIITASDNILSLNAEVNHFYTKKSNSKNIKLKAALLRIIKNIPFITAIAFSGGTANYGLDKHDDIDLFIISKPHSVYIVYALIHLISVILKSRTVLCVNYMVDEIAVEIKIHRDLYTAQQIIALMPFTNSGYIDYFLFKNSWISEFYPNYKIPENVSRNISPVYNVLSPFNRLLEKLYRKRYKKLLETAEDESIVLTENIIKLHTNNYRKKIITEFENEWFKYLNKEKIFYYDSIAK
ncbi:MAG: glycosyltransferase family 4 protein [Syntrophothermus sp.]